MPANGLTLARQADLLVERIRGVPERQGIDPRVGQLPTVAEVVPFPSAVELEADLALCRLDDKGRFHFAGLGDLLGWSPGDDLDVETRSHWLVLRRNGERSNRRGARRFNARDRVTLPLARTFPLHLAGERQVLVMPVPSVNALAVCKPTLIFVAAPRDLDHP